MALVHFTALAIFFPAAFRIKSKTKISKKDTPPKSARDEGAYCFCVHFCASPQHFGASYEQCPWVTSVCIFVQTLTISGPHMSHAPASVLGIVGLFSGSISYQVKHQNRQKPNAAKKCEERRALIFFGAFLCKLSTFRNLV